MTATLATAAAAELTNEQFKKDQLEYEEFVRSLGPDCYDEIGKEKRPNKVFFRQAARRFDVDVVVLHEESETVDCNPDVCPKACSGKHYEVRFTVRAIRRDTGRHMDGDGSCIDNDKWLPRSKRCFANQLKSVIKALRRYSEDDAKHLVAIVSEQRTTQPHHLHPLEAKALIEFIYGDTPGLEPPVPIRNTRHNVRGTARTRAVNRAVSDLVCRGIVSAEEHSHTDKEVENAENTQTETPPATSRRQQQPAPSAPTAPAAKPISEFQKNRIEKHSVYKSFTDAQRMQFISDATAGDAADIGQLTTTTASKVITALDNANRNAQGQQAHG